MAISIPLTALEAEYICALESLYLPEEFINMTPEQEYGIEAKNDEKHVPQYAEYEYLWVSQGGIRVTHRGQTAPLYTARWAVAYDDIKVSGRTLRLALNALVATSNQRHALVLSAVKQQLEATP